VIRNGHLIWLAWKLVAFAIHSLTRWQPIIIFSLPLSGLPKHPLVLLLLLTAQTRSRMTSDLEIHAYGARIKSDRLPALEYMFDAVAFPPHRLCLNGRTI